MSTYLVTNKSTSALEIGGVSIGPGMAETVVFDGALPKYVTDLRDSGVISLVLQSDVQGVVLIDPDTNLPYKASGGTGPGGSSDTKESTQLLVKDGVVSLNTVIGTQADAAAANDTVAASLMSLIRRALANWTTLLGRVPAVGAKASAASMPVVLASDQAAIGVTNTALSSLDGKTPTLGQKTAAGSSSVVLASDVETPVKAVTRTCTGRQALALTAATVTSLTPPGSSVACLIQADGNTIRVTLDASNPSATAGQRLDDSMTLYVDSALASVRLFAPLACTAQIEYFDKA